MNVTIWLLLITAFVALGGVTWWACAWWYGRRVRDLQHKLERTRKVAIRHAQQLRNQIVQLQRELNTHRLAREQLLARQIDYGVLESQASANNSEGAPPLPASGFADTQPM